MAHETNHEQAEKEKKNSIISFKAAFGLVVIVLFLFIAALSFIKVMSSSKEENNATSIAKPNEKSATSDSTHH